MINEAEGSFVETEVLRSWTGSIGYRNDGPGETSSTVHVSQTATGQDLRFDVQVRYA